jgi:hypothetical protein
MYADTIHQTSAGLVVKVYTTPKELRWAADKLEQFMGFTKPNDRPPFVVLMQDNIMELHLIHGQYKQTPQKER